MNYTSLGRKNNFLPIYYDFNLHNSEYYIRIYDLLGVK